MSPRPKSTVHTPGSQWMRTPLPIPPRRTPPRRWAPRRSSARSPATRRWRWQSCAPSLFTAPGSRHGRWSPNSCDRSAPASGSSSAIRALCGTWCTHGTSRPPWRRQASRRWSRRLGSSTSPAAWGSRRWRWRACCSTWPAGTRRWRRGRPTDQPPRRCSSSSATRGGPERSCGIGPKSASRTG